MFFLSMLQFFMEGENLILPSEKNQNISLWLVKMYLESSIVSPIEVIFYGLEDIEHFCWIGPAFDVDQCISIEKSHEFAGFYCGRHNN